MVPLSVATACLSAFLAFAVEPLVGRLLLPTYGGAAAVWTTALVFFQGALLLGYALAHVLIRWLGVRRAAFVELGVVALPLLALPVALPAAAAPPDGWDTAAWLLGVLIVTVVAPFVALATATPTLQRWLAAAGGAAARHGAFRLFAAANVGSLVGLLAYPTLIEPNLDLDAQARLWAAGYVAFGLLVAVGVVVVARRAAARWASRWSAGRSARRYPRPRRVRLGWIGAGRDPGRGRRGFDRPTDDRRRGGAAPVGRPPCDLPGDVRARLRWPTTHRGPVRRSPPSAARRSAS